MSLQRLFHIFGLPLGTNTDTVKEDLERIIGQPESVICVVPPEKCSYFTVDAESVEVVEKLKRHRQQIRIDGRSCVLVFNDILGNFEMSHDNRLLSAALEQYRSKFATSSFYEGVRLFPGTNTDMKVSREVSTVVAASLQAAVNFDDKMRKALFDEIPSPTTVESVSLDTVDDASACSPVRPKLSKSWLVLKVRAMDKVFDIALGPGDVFSEGMDAVVLPTFRNLMCHDPNYRNLLTEEAGVQYHVARESFLTAYKELKEGRASAFAGNGRLVKWIIHVSINENASFSQLADAYTSCLAKANEVGCKTLAFTPFLPEQNLTASAEAAAKAILEGLQTGDTNGNINFAYYNAIIAQQFAKIFADYYSSGKTSITVTRDDLTGSKCGYDFGKMDVAMALEPKSTDAKVADAAAAVAAQWAEVEVPLEKRKPFRRQPANMKQRSEEKRKRKEQTQKRLIEMNRRFTQLFIRKLGSEFPDQGTCAVCKQAVSPHGDPDLIDETEMCPSCRETFHITCVDQSGFGTCPLCVTDIFLDNGEIFSCQLGGTMNVRVVQEGKPEPNYDDFEGYIELTYSIPSGVQGPLDPEPGKFYYGTHRVAYLPYTEDGIWVAELLRVAFQRGLTFMIGKTLSLWDDYVVTWNCIPHKTSLTGGRSNCGYPDETYLSRVMHLLNNLGVDVPRAVTETEKEVV